MAGKTPYLSLAYFDFADRLDFRINARREVDRFVTIDKQLYGLYSIFGDGVISGWDVFNNGFSDTTGISVGISSGQGLIAGIACQTSQTSVINGLLPNLDQYIFATKIGSTSYDRRVEFIASQTRPSASSILLASVVTTANGISDIDTTLREAIGFTSDVIADVLTHKHRGTPSKIDLVLETKNTLPASKIEDFDATKVTQGIFDRERIPQLLHDDLDNNGVLTHPQLDSIARTLISDNNSLFDSPLMGDVALINQLQQILFLKYKYENVDKFFVNQLCAIPGVNQVFDEYHSTAYIREKDQCIIGLPTSNNTTYLFTDNLYLPDKIDKILLTSNKSIPYGSSISFGVNTTNSVDFNDYQIIDENTVQDINAVGQNMRIGIKFVYSDNIDPFDEYSFTFEDFIDFAFLNETLSTIDFHFRIRWYTDAELTDLYLTKYSANDQENWIVNDTDPIPTDGYPVPAESAVIVTYFPDLSLFQPNQIYYLVIDGYDGSSFVSEVSGYTFITNQGSGVCAQYGYLPQVKNFAFMFSTENNNFVRLNQDIIAQSCPCSWDDLEADGWLELE